MRVMTNEEMGVLTGDGPDKKVERLNLMLHSCCGPCSSSVIERLAGEFNITVLYYNPCITDEEEYKRRRAAQVEFIEKFNAERIDLPDINLVEGPYEPGAFLEITKGHEEDPEGGYMVNGDYDIALYCMLTDNSGDPAYFINTMLSKDSSYGVFGFDNADCQKLIDELNVETDTNKRAELANKIIQMTIDDNNIGYLAFINKVIAAKQGVKNVAENYPNDMFGLFADSTK